MLSILLKSPLFEGLSKKQIEFLLKLLPHREISLMKNETIILAGDCVKELGVVLSGQLTATREDRFGGSAVISSLLPGDLLGEILASSEALPSPVTVTAAVPTTVLLFDYYSILDEGEAGGEEHDTMRRNLLRQIAKKYFSLMRRTEYLGIHSLRERVSAYLLDFEKEEFLIPFDRAKMANFLGVDRSALSRELGRMKREGLIDFQKSRFRILKLGDSE